MKDVLTQKRYRTAGDLINPDRLWALYDREKTEPANEPHGVYIVDILKASGRDTVLVTRDEQDSGHFRLMGIYPAMMPRALSIWADTGEVVPVKARIRVHKRIYRETNSQGLVELSKGELEDVGIINVPRPRRDPEIVVHNLRQRYFEDHGHVSLVITARRLASPEGGNQGADGISVYYGREYKNGEARQWELFMRGREPMSLMDLGPWEAGQSPRGIQLHGNPEGAMRDVFFSHRMPGERGLPTLAWFTDAGEDIVS